MVTAGIVWFGLSRIDLSETLDAFSGVRLEVVAAGAALVVCTVCLFALRWQILLGAGGRVPFHSAFSFLMIGYMINAILPMRAGDLARAYLIGRRHKIAVAAALSSVVVERLFDVVAIVLLGMFISSLLELPALVAMGLRIFAALGTASFLVLLALSFWARRAGGLPWLTRKVSRVSFMRALVIRLEHFCLALAVLHDWRRLIATSILSLVGWGLLAAAQGAFLASLGLQVPYFAGALVAVATALGAAIPSAPASVGVYHFLTVLALSAWNVPTAQAVAAGVLSHAVVISLHIAIGAACAWIAGLRLLSLSRVAFRESEDRAV